MKRASRIIAGLVPLTLIASIWAVQDSTPPEDPKVELSKVLAPEIRSMDSGAVLQRGNQVGFVSCSTWDRTVNIFWSASPLMNEKPDWDNALQQWEDLIDVLDNDYQEYPVAFYPNLAEVIDANTLLVAGATADQESIIEKWTLKWPAVEEEPALDPQTGKLSVEVILPVEITTQLIFLGGTRNDPQFIRAMCGVATQEDGVVASLVLFHESNELYTLDLGSNELSLLADPMQDAGARPLFTISLAQWSLHRTIRGGALDNLDFARAARQDHGIEAVEYVNQFFKDRATDFDYLGEMKLRAADQGVRRLLIMIDGEGALADADDGRRRRAIENHFKWVAAARFLGCHSIRVNAGGSGEYEEQLARAADSLHRLADLADPYDVDVIVENHGGYSSNGAWLAAVMKRADHPRVGTLPDFGNFNLGGGKKYDRYQGVDELMPFAQGVSAKSHDFDDAGNEKSTRPPRKTSPVPPQLRCSDQSVSNEGGP